MIRDTTTTHNFGLPFPRQSFPNLEEHLTFIQKVLREGMWRTRFPQNPPVVPDNFSVTESEAGKYYAEASVHHNVYIKNSGIYGRCDDIDNFARTNHPDMFECAIAAFSL